MMEIFIPATIDCQEVFIGRRSCHRVSTKDARSATPFLEQDTTLSMR
jgi:hypothetical protein